MSRDGEQRARRFAADAAIALAATAAEVALLVDDGSVSAAAVALTVTAGAALVGRRAAAPLVLSATLAAAIAIVAIGEAPAGVMVLVALYTTAATRDRRMSVAALVVTAPITSALSVATDSASSPVVGALTAAVLSAGVWGLGAYAQAQRRYRQALEERAERLAREREQLDRIALHEERAAIARELHDIVANSVGVMLVGVRGARDVLRSQPDVAADTLARVEAGAEESLLELRRILALLREPRHVAESRPQPSLRELDDLVAHYRESGLPARLVVSGEARALASGVELSVYRVVQEALTNALKHANATEVAVTLSFHGTHLAVEVVDDGRPVAGHVAPTGNGILGMRERVALLGGQLDVGPRAGGGFRVAARIPLGGAAG